MSSPPPQPLSEALRRLAARTDRDAARDASWQQYLAEGAGFAAAPVPERERMLAILAARPVAPAVPVPEALSRWQRWRGLFDVGWDARNRTPMGQRFAGMSVSLLINLFFVLFMLASLYLRLGTVPEPEPETVRIRITGFGTPNAAGGGQEAAEGDLSAQGGVAANQASAVARASSAQAATRQQQAPEVETAPAMVAPSVASMRLPDISQAQIQTQALPAPQPLQVTTPPIPQPSDFQLPPPRSALTMPQARTELRSQELPQENTLPAPLPEVRAINRPSVAARSVQAPSRLPAEREIPAPLQAPQVDVPELGLRRTAPQIAVREVGQRALPALPAEQMQGNQTASNVSASTQVANSAQEAVSAAAQSAGRAASAAPAKTPAPAGLPGARGASAQPGQAATQIGAGPQRAAASTGWPSPVRGDDWGAAAQNRAGQANGADRGAGQGSGLFNADGRPRLADDSFKPRFPDPTKEGTWMRRPGMETRGTMFDGIWRPPETLLQEWVRRGVKSVRIPIPGTNMELECVVSLLQAAGGCLPVGGKDGVFDQPARARQPPDVPFKRDLFEDPEALQKPDSTDQ